MCGDYRQCNHSTGYLGKYIYPELFMCETYVVLRLTSGRSCNAFRWKTGKRLTILNVRSDRQSPKFDRYTVTVSLTLNFRVVVQLFILLLNQYACGWREASILCNSCIPVLNVLLKGCSVFCSCMQITFQRQYSCC